MNDITRDLAALATTAPETLAPSVLAATGTGRFYDTVSGPTGDLLVGWTGEGIYAVAPLSELEAFLTDYTRGGLAPVAADLPAALHRQVTRSLESGKLGRLPVDLSELSDFQRAVLRKTAEIPPGQLRPYGWVAREIGKPGATQP